MYSGKSVGSRRGLSLTIMWVGSPFFTIVMELVLSSFVRVFRKSIKCVYYGIFLSSWVRCHLRMVADGSFEVNNLIRTTFEATGSSSFSKA
jgi:hypothetical protein